MMDNRDDKQLDQRINQWLEGEAPRQLPDRVLNATFERTRKLPQQRGWHGLLAGLHVAQLLPALAGGAVILLLVVFATGLLVNRPGIGGLASPTPPLAPTATPSPEPTEPPTPAPTEPFTPAPTPAGLLGTWYSMDPPPESSHLTMDLVARLAGGFDLTIHDDAAAVCQSVSSTMTGVAQETEPRTFVVARPDFVCDDGSKPHSLNGQPFKDLIRNYTLIYDPANDVLNEPAGLTWTRTPTDK
jgi:hypothetical protein